MLCTKGNCELRLFLCVSLCFLLLSLGQYDSEFGYISRCLGALVVGSWLDDLCVVVSPFVTPIRRAKTLATFLHLHFVRLWTSQIRALCSPLHHNHNTSAHHTTQHILHTFLHILHIYTFVLIMDDEWETTTHDTREYLYTTVYAWSYYVVLHFGLNVGVML